jgi:uncharacterized protein (DUF1778 family)
MAKEVGVRKKKWRVAATRRTTAIYFPEEGQLTLVKRAARALGIPWTRFIREACVAKANDVMLENSERKAS